MTTKTKCSWLFSILFLLAGCEAPLNLERVNSELEKKIHRTDQFHRMATNNEVLIVVGASGLILSSPLSELKWQRKMVSKQSYLIDVDSCQDQSFIALGTDKQVWHSSDNGDTWTSMKLPTQEDVLALTCAPDNSIWVVGSFTTILHSVDQGATWQETSLNEDSILTGIQFVNEKVAFISGEFGLVSRSDDGGSTWRQANYIPEDFYIQDAHFSNSLEGWVAGLSGQIQHTSDGGENWQQQKTPINSPIFGLYQSPNRLLAVGDHSTLLEYNGEVWVQMETSGKPVYLRDAIQLPSGQLLLAGGSGSLYTRDNSKSSLARNFEKREL